MTAYAIYFGKATEMGCEENDTDHLFVSEKIVVVLLSCAEFLDQGYVVTVDNWYCSKVSFLTKYSIRFFGNMHQNSSTYKIPHFFICDILELKCRLLHFENASSDICSVGQLAK